ncbi:MAG: glycosyltransferase family A protein [Verrucomicrobiota bacterium]
MSPKVSIVIPVRDRSSLLRRAVDSVRAQRFRDWELTIVDDGSAEPVSLAWEPSERISVIRFDESAGVAVARNEGVGVSRGEWICFLDSDDEWDPDKLLCQMNWHDNHPEILLSQVEEEWFWNGVARKKPKHWRARGGDLFARSLVRCSIGPSCVMMKREVWNQSQGFDPAFDVCEDYDLWIRVTAIHRTGLVKGPALVRKHGGHPDQLSLSVPAMDRFRIVSLLQFWSRETATEKQKNLVVNEIGRKASRVREGAQKRGHADRTELYDEVAHWAESGTQMEAEDLIDRIWREIHAEKSVRS